jgi:ribosome-associated protein
VYNFKNESVIKKSKALSDEQILLKIVEGIQEKKGKEIVLVNMTKLKESPCSYFVICEGDSLVHVNAVASSVLDYVNEKIQIKPFATDGFENCEWIAMDYGHILVHVFQRHAREYYDLEHLWADASIKKFENLN